MNGKFWIHFQRFSQKSNQTESNLSFLFVHFVTPEETEMMPMASSKIGGTAGRDGGTADGSGGTSKQ